ncbi:MAG TPA: metal-dependent hydrolase, partial [Paraburkholderia sp.]
MQKSPTPQPAAALDSRQLDLLFEEPGLSQSPALQKPAVPLAPDGSKLRHITLGARSLYYQLKRSSRRSIGFAIDGNGLT